MIKPRDFFTSIVRGLNRKTWLILIAVLLLGSLPFCIEYDRPVSEEKLPAEARTFLKEHFPGRFIAFAEKELEMLVITYEVILVDGTKIAFSRTGKWQKVDCKFTHVPPAIIPQPIAAFLQSHGLPVRVQEIEKERGTYEIKLPEGIEITFDDDTFTVVDYEQ